MSDSYYTDLREYLKVLEGKQKLVRIRRPINKDTELQPLVRLQFRGLPESQRRAFFFEQVTDSRGKGYDMPVVVGCMAGTRDIYAIGMQVESTEQISERWLAAQKNVVPPVRVDRGVVHENVYTGADLERVGGLGLLPIPISTPGFDNAPYTSASHWVTRDPDTGVYNVGNYRGQIKAPLKLGCFAAARQDFGRHWRKYRAKGRPMPAAVVMGVAPNLSYVSVAKLPEQVDEYEVAGGIARRPVELVKCKTVDLEVPAHAEIVIEGIVPTDVVELEGPFGEFPGYMAKTEITKFMNVTAITHRNNPILQTFISQFPPSESSMIRGTAAQGILLKFLRVDQGMDNVRRVVLHESTGSWGLTVIQVKEPRPDQVARIFEAIRSEPRMQSKWMIVVDDDIDPEDADSINWALAFRCQPARDTHGAPMGEMSLDPSISDPRAEDARNPLRTELTRASSLFIDATRKWPYPPTSLPGRKYMERALEIWKEEGLPELKLKTPWYGTNLGYWPAEREEEAALALSGRHYETGAKFAQHSRRLKPDETV